MNMHVEHLVDAHKDDRPPELATSRWLSTIDDSLRNRLANFSLCESVDTRSIRTLTVNAWIDEYIHERKDVKPATIESYEKGRHCLIDFFGKKKLLKDVTRADAKKWRIWIAEKGNRRDKKRKSLSSDTVRRRTGLAKQFFKEAVERGYIKENPFSKLTSATQGNESRQHFVTHEIIDRCIKFSPCIDWRTILALARYGGFRVPSELVVLKWKHVDLENRRMIVNASKTEHHADGGMRICPIFPKLLPHLEFARSQASRKSEFVINRYRRKDQNLRETFIKILDRAGVEKWPRLFQNLRASLETELLAKFPAKDVTTWLGNSEAVAMRHYAMATEDTFRAAAGLATDSSGGVIGGDKLANPEPSTTKTEIEGSIEKYLKKGLSIVIDDQGRSWIVGVEGPEKTAKTREISTKSIVAVSPAVQVTTLPKALQHSIRRAII